MTDPITSDVGRFDDIPCCPCCGYTAAAFDQSWIGLHTCKICGWVDDVEQRHLPDLDWHNDNGGMTLREAQRNYFAFGQADGTRVRVEPPSDYYKHPDWLPLPRPAGWPKT